jgi:branched-chain amino acid transport system substrate-binding protein
VGRAATADLRAGVPAVFRLSCVNAKGVAAVGSGAWQRVFRLDHQRHSAVLLGLGLFGGSLLGCGASNPVEGSVTVAVAAPFASTSLMVDARQAWQLVVDQVNEDGGIEHERLAVHERDTPLADASDLAPVADGFVHLTDEGYKYIISLVGGGALQPMMDAAMPHGVLTMSIISEDSASDLPEYDGMLLRGILPTDRLLQKQARALQANGLDSLVVVGETSGGVVDPRHQGMLDAYASCAACRVASVTYPAEADLYRYDWESVGAQVMASNPAVIFLASEQASSLLDTIFWIEKAGYTGLYYFAQGAFLGSLPASMPGSTVPQRFRSYDLALPPSDRLDQFLGVYRERYGEDFVPEPRLIAFADYLALLALAMTRVGDEDPRSVSAAMKELAGPPGERYGTLDYAAAAAAVRAGQDIDFVGLSGPLDFDARGEVTDGFVQEFGVTAGGDVTPLP